MKILAYAILLFSQLHCLAQTNTDSLSNHQDTYILNTYVFQKGIYKNFEEFKFNNPSTVDNFLFDNKNLWLTNSMNEKLKKIKKREVWGFCDGTRIYVKWRKYNELLEMGRYCYFKEKGTKVVMAVSIFPPMILPIPLPYKDEVIINFNTGNAYLLRKKLMKKILTTDDEELMGEFMNETHKRKKLFNYIIKYNKRNVAKIK